MATYDVEFDRMVNEEICAQEIDEQTPPVLRNIQLLLSIVTHSKGSLDFNKACRFINDHRLEEFRLLSAALDEAWKMKSYGKIRNMGQHPDLYHQRLTA